MPWFPPRAWAAAALLAGACVGLALWHHSRVQAADAAGYSRGHALFLQLQSRVQEQALKATQAARDEEARRYAARKEIDDAHQAELVRLRADAAVADAAAGRLRQRVADLIAAARGAYAPAANPAAVQPGPAAADAAGMLADVLGRCIGRVRQLAAIADHRGAAGTACQREYDALTPSLPTLSTPPTAFTGEPTP